MGEVEGRAGGESVKLGVRQRDWGAAGNPWRGGTGHLPPPSRSPEHNRGANAEQPPPQCAPPSTHLRKLRRRSEALGCPAALEQCGARHDLGMAASSSLAQGDDVSGEPRRMRGAARRYSNGLAHAR